MLALCLAADIDEPFGGKALLRLPGRAESAMPRHDTAKQGLRLPPCLFAEGTAVAKGSQGPLQLVHMKGPDPCSDSAWGTKEANCAFETGETASRRFFA
jgi:hypothetical protein